MGGVAGSCFHQYFRKWAAEVNNNLSENRWGGRWGCSGNCPQPGQSEFFGVFCGFGKGSDRGAG